MYEDHLSDVTFASLDLPSGVLQGIEEAGFKLCTPIQAKTLPLALKGHDIAGQAQTGTGKTAAFLIATFNKLLSKPASEKRKATQPRALILAPTRELAVQIHSDAMALAAHMPFRIVLAYGGTGYEKQRQELEGGVDILIGTPGRIIDYFKQGVFDLKACQVAVLDEADRMFDLGFIKDVRYMLRRMPAAEERLNMLFSATLSLRVTELAYEHMNNPHIVKIESDNVTADKIDQSVYYVANDEKISVLINLMQQIKPIRSIIFANTKRATERVHAYLKGNELDAAVLSGDVPQKKRSSLLKQFQNGELDILVATDVAARGLHIPEVSHIFNFDLPEDAEDYVHRIGRTGRAGASGIAISLACETYAFSLADIETYIGHKIASKAVTDELLVQVKAAHKIKHQARSKHSTRAHDGKHRRSGSRSRQPSSRHASKQ
ncbi:MAG: ATP-dependent RNA helicase RhlB [Gammaproteobacteria bacterium]|nr:ATP-dependent RNA helicase RhlB [Gammaproteobacteria bacterium]